MRNDRFTLRNTWLACVLTACACACAAQTSRPEGPVTTPLRDRVIPLEAVVNGIRTGTWPFVERQGQLHAPRDAFDEWRIQLRYDAAPILFRGTEYFPLAAVPGFSMKVNYANQAVEITFAGEAFGATRLTRELAARPKLSPVVPSAFLNYDLNFSTSRQGGAGETRDVGAVMELGASNGWGVFTSTHAARDLAHDNVAAGRRWLRLESTYTRHLPQDNRTLRLGDTATRQGLWGRSVYFGGVQLSTNYSLTPGFLTQPVPLVTGISAAPSTVELYVNDALRRVSSVPAGPFVIDNTQFLTGAGEARLVVRDILGRETVIVQPFFSNVLLLAPGLNDWSVEAGAARENLGTENADYGPGFTSATWRRGLSDRLTMELRSEASRAGQTFGVGAVAALPGDVLGRAAAVASRHETLGTGHQVVLGLEREWTRSSLFGQVQAWTRDYYELGTRLDTVPNRVQWAANFSHSIGAHAANVGVSGLRRYGEAEVRTLSANWSSRLPGNATVALTFSKVIGRGDGTAVGVTLNLPLTPYQYLTATASSQAGSHDHYVTASRVPGGEDSDLGWRVLGGRFQGDARSELGLNYGGRYGRVYADLSAASDQQALRAGASGGLVWVGEHLFATRRVDESFGLVELKGYGGIGVGLGSNIMTHTDASGVALLPYLAAYQGNQVRLDVRDLPISAEIDSVEQVVVPAWRSAVKVEFPVRAGRAALLKIHLDDGGPAPAGATVRIEGEHQEFFVARRGEAFVTGLQPASALRLQWKGQECRFTATLPPAANDEIARIGPVACGGVKR